MPDGRTIAPALRRLLDMPFCLRIASRDWHPADHVSFAARHAGAEPGRSTLELRHPTDPARRCCITLWPRHCLQHAPGACLADGLDGAAWDAVIDKGADRDVEMLSAFGDVLGLVETDLASRLRAAAISHLFIAGLAADVCVRATALSALEHGFKTCIVREGVRPIFPDRWLSEVRELEAKGISLVSLDGPEIARVLSLSPTASSSPTD